MIGATLTLGQVYADMDLSGGAKSLGFWENTWYVISSPFYDFEKPTVVESICLGTSGNVTRLS